MAKRKNKVASSKPKSYSRPISFVTRLVDKANPQKKDTERVFSPAEERNPDIEGVMEVKAEIEVEPQNSQGEKFRILQNSTQLIFLPN